MNLRAYLERMRSKVEGAMEGLLPETSGPAATVNRAMRYAVMGGGKRLRPILTLAACEACGGDIEEALAPACALEMIHTYSLVHDDLPAMDDDDLRRGRPTAHVVFGEAEAVLAGDGLLTLAFEILAAMPPGEQSAKRRCQAVALVARAAGYAGMVGGQMGDLEAERLPVDLALLNWIHRHKTGALLAASVELGAVIASAPDAQRSALSRYGMSLGLAFQITDDLLDITSTADQLGKTPGKDVRDGKATYPALLGMDESVNKARSLIQEAIAELQTLRNPSPPLESIARYVLERTH